MSGDIQAAHVERIRVSLAEERLRTRGSSDHTVNLSPPLRPHPYALSSFQMVAAPTHNVTVAFWETLNQNHLLSHF